MRVRFGAYFLLPPVLFLLALMVACAGASNPPPETSLPDTPPAQPATPLPASAQMAMDDFTKQQETIDQEWDRFHQEFDQWRAGLISCHRSSVQVALQDFAVSFNSVTEQARDLPRTAATRKLADILIDAALAEEAAFRQLRDRWQPNNISLFERVEEERSDAALAQKKAEDLAIDLQKELEESAAPEAIAAVEEFSKAFDDIKDNWKRFHADYSDLRKEADELDTPAVIARLEKLIERFDDMVEAIEELPSADATENMIEMLQRASAIELESLKSLKDALAASGPEPVPELPGAGKEKDALGPLVLPIPTPSPGSDVTIDELLDDLDANVKESELVLKEISRSIKAIIDASPEESLAEIKDFNEDYRSLLVEWDTFHQRYGDWRKTEGGCDRTEVLQTLGQFSLRVNGLGRQVRDLPQASYLLPMYTLLVEAAEREEGAIRALQNSWRPFNVDVFKAVDQQRVHADRLRRQADIGLQELRERF